MSVKGTAGGNGWGQRVVCGESREAGGVGPSTEARRRSGGQACMRGREVEGLGPSFEGGEYFFETPKVREGGVRGTAPPPRKGRGSGTPPPTYPGQNDLWEGV